MEDIHDCKDRLICKGNPYTGLVESIYKWHKTSTYLSVGEKFRIERQGVVTTVTRASGSAFEVESHIIAA